MQMGRDDVRKAYNLMRTIRVLEDRVHVEFQTGDMSGLVHLYAGEEASAVGVCMHLADKDKIIPVAHSRGMDNVTIIHGAGHMVHVEDSKTVNSQLLAFMPKIDNLVDATP
jgi:hypothetical protein